MDYHFSVFEKTYDISVKFQALPRIPLLLLFNDRDDEFPSNCSVLFKGNAGYFLDPECLAIPGGLLFRRLKGIK